MIGGGGGTYTSGNDGATNDQDKNRNNDKCNQGDQAGNNPIQVSRGAETLAVNLFALPGEMGLSYSLFYVSPRGWYDNLGYRLATWCPITPGSGGGPGGPGGPPFPPRDPVIGDGDECTLTHVTFYRPDGSSLAFTGAPGTVGNYPEIGGGGLATLTMGADGAYTLRDEDGSTLVFNGNGDLMSVKNTAGIGWTLVKTTGTGTVTQKVTHTNGASFTVTRQASSTANGVTTTPVTVTDPAGNIYQYVMQRALAVGNSLRPLPFQLTSLALPGAPATTITYKYATAVATGNPINLTEVDYNGAPYFYATYDSAGRASGTRLGDNSESYSVVYTLGSGGSTMTAAITNPLGHTTTNNYGARYGGQFLLTSVSNPAVVTCSATTATIAYDSNGNRTRAVDNNGIAHTYSYAANGQLQTETEAAGTTQARTTSYVWDPNQQLNHLLSVTVAGLSKTTYVYNAQNRLASVSRTNLSGTGTPNQLLTTTYAYGLYGNGMVKTMTVTAPSPGGTAKVTHAYDALGNLASVTDGRGYVTSYAMYNGLGQAGRIIGPNGDRTDFAYDARGRIASKTTYANGTAAVWNYAYDGFGLLSRVAAPNGEVTTWSRDGVMRVKTITHNDNDGTSTETLAYNANGDVTSSVVARGGDVGRAVYYTYDGLGRVYQVQGANGQKVTYTYDGNGNTLSAADALGRTARFAYDALNRVVKATDPANGTIQYAYDAAGQITKVTDPRGLATSYARDGLGQLWQQQSPDTGITKYAYDGYGRLSSLTRADGVVTGLAYDAVNRVISASAGGQTRTWTWDNCTNGKQRLCAAANAGSSINYSYTPEGWVGARAVSITNGPIHMLAYAYNAVGQVTEVLYPDGNKALYDYSNGAVSGVRLQVGAYTVSGVTGVTYRPMDMAMSGWTSYNGLANTITYDRDLRATAITVPNVQSLAFTYDAADRITTITNGMNGAYSQNLAYDALDRLKSMSSPARSENYQYDAVGNRTWQSINGSATSFAHAATSNRLMGASGSVNASFGYNAYGSMTTRNGATAYSYDAFARLVNASGAAFVVSAEDQRVRKSFGGNVTDFVPDAGGALLAENVNGTWKDYVWLNGRMVAMLIGGGVYSIHADQTGRAMYVTDMGPKGGLMASTADVPPVPSEPPGRSLVVWASRNDPFDRNTVVGDPEFFRMGFPGQYWDAEDNLWHNGYRDYDYQTGRYIQSDPIGLAGGVNTYAYVGSNPISYTDFLGLRPGDCYPSMDVAGENAVNDINGTSIRTNTEYAGYVYGNSNGTYSYTAPVKGTANTASLIYSVGRVGMYHTHGADVPPGYGAYENFSKQDRQAAVDFKLISYLGTPLGAIKKFDPSTGKTTTLPPPGLNNSDACKCR